MIDRTPDAVLALIGGINVEQQFCFKPHRIADVPGGEPFVATECNGYAVCVTAAMGCALPAGKLANELAVWLSSEDGVAAGWSAVDQGKAVWLANAGVPVVAVVVEAGHGHIGVLVPSPHDDQSSPYVSAAGRQCFVRAKLERSFGGLKPLFFTHS